MSDKDTEDFIPRKRKGWDGQDMEMSHKREKTHESNAVAAVDLNQFRNTEVGQGYQAKHVFRQKTGMENKTKVVDMSRGASQKKASLIKDERLSKYLKCAGIREFRRQLEKIVNST
mmetsp:Transcript_25594/g.37813  ORF Transcript_25594/g.37813 Transcript_25594/m.37813 type:complete len:116 (-) Transcript_25594:7-354(-)